VSGSPSNYTLVSRLQFSHLFELFPLIPLSCVSLSIIVFDAAELSTGGNTAELHPKVLDK
jgi:hypothetical protein